MLKKTSATFSNNRQAFIRLLITFLLALCLALIGLSYLIPRYFPGAPYAERPVVSTPNAPTGEFPAHQTGFQQWIWYGPETLTWPGIGFFMEYEPGEVIAVSAGHTIDSSRATGVYFKSSDPAEGYQLDLLQYFGQPGRARFFSHDFTVDYAFFAVTESVPNIYVLQPDPRGNAEVGEIVYIDNGIGLEADQSQRLLMRGIVQTQNESVIWIALDERVVPGGMSGSPVISAHTGKLIGMAVGATVYEDRTMIGLHPVGSLVEKARSTNLLFSMPISK